jgi:hypothetical protein
MFSLADNPGVLKAKAKNGRFYKDAKWAGKMPIFLQAFL